MLGIRKCTDLQGKDTVEKVLFSPCAPFCALLDRFLFKLKDSVKL